MQVEHLSLPMGWQSQPLASLVFEITSGGTPESGNPRYYTEIGIPFAKIEDLTRSGNRFLDDTELHITESALRESTTRIFPPGTIVVSMYGTIGLVKILKRPIATNQAIAALLAPFRCNPAFLTQVLEYSRDQLIRSASQTTQANISGSVLKTFQIILPQSLTEQHRIAEILDTVDTAIQQTEALITKLKQMKAGLLHDLLTRGLDEHGQLRDPHAHPEQFKDSPLGWLPREWEVVPLGTIAEIASGVTLGRNLSGPGTAELPYLRVANVQDGYLDLDEIKTIRVRKDEVPRFLLQPGDVLMNEGGDFDKLGRGTVWAGQISPCLHQNHVFRVRVDPQKLRPEFVAAVSASSYGKRFFILSSKQSTNLASINSTQLKSFPIPCPSIAEQDLVLEAIRAHDIHIRAEEAYRDKLKQLKKGLMDDLLTGRVRVNVAEEVAP